MEGDIGSLLPTICLWLNEEILTNNSSFTLRICAYKFICVQCIYDYIYLLHIEVIVVNFDLF